MMATRLFGFFPRSDANDPETFIAGATAMLARYPEAVVTAVCDPIRGLPGTNKFLPAIAEIREACEREMVWHDAVVRRDRVREQTLAGRRDGHKAPLGSSEHRQVVKGFAGLREAMEAKQAADPRPKPFTLPVVAEEKPLFADRPVSTPDLAKYLRDMTAAVESDEAYDKQA
jgi:hypothetical protein